MKYKIFLIVIILIILCGCSKKEDPYADFKHYDLIDKEKEAYDYYKYGDEYKKGYEIETYVLADITPEKYESYLTGLFYKVAEDDYILLEKFESASDLQHQFYNDKLYGRGYGNTPVLFAVELKGKNSKIKELNFEIDGEKVFPYSFGKVEDDTIYITTFALENGHNVMKGLKCSLVTYQCLFAKND